ncbi:MAG TPA: BON domain-containing protein [Ramlibacter sp.]|nr:BON domain-containing protein [Aquabacterium sp.]HYF44090.1 BON domain-containing protein [Ramlibacter sp.]
MRAGLLAFVLAAPTGWAQPATNAFNDPFVQVTSAIAACPVPAGPLYTEQEARDAAHVRSHHGTSCYRSGRCRLPNSYLYDAEIIPRVVQYIRNDGRFADTSVWVIGERRLVHLLGCVNSREQAQALEKAVTLVDDVMGVIDFLSVPGEAPRYPLRK